MSRNKIEPGQEIEFLLPGDAPLIYTVPENGLRDADGNWVQAINNPAHVFSMPCPHEVPVNAAIRSRTKHPTPQSRLTPIAEPKSMQSHRIRNHERYAV